MLIHSATQLLTLSGGPQRGHDLGRLGIIEDGAVLIRDEKIVEVGKTTDLRADHPNEPLLDAYGCVVMPGFVDPHTHVIWGGDRAKEFLKDGQRKEEGVNTGPRAAVGNRAEDDPKEGQA